MSLLPMLFSDWWEDLERPHRLLDQHFGLTLSPEDIARRSLPSVNPGVLVLRPDGHLGLRLPQHHRYDVGRPHGTSVVKADKDQFQVTLDVQQFAPEEVSVKVVGKHVVVEAKHEEKKDQHGWISRQFVRKYMIPSQCDIEQVSSSLSSDGVLSITAPRKVAPGEDKEKVIKIQHTGQPAIKDDAVSAGSTGGAKGEKTQKNADGKKTGTQDGKKNAV